ncbi:MAG TPA: amidase, partial [Massilia sp.]|nr:amidase [Massilia sp.]
YVPTEHASVVRRYLDAGLVVFGKTNLPEFALKAVTDPQLYGRSSNPWDLGRTPGGSSG